MTFAGSADIFLDGMAGESVSVFIRDFDEIACSAVGRAEMVIGAKRS